ncbi:PBSX family phage portal protein [Fusobacterium naviforme]|nr:phage portal protein [Fusobacterium naviforme]PSL10205.1 PBSX family phage portal protein [Fusobacterium naviforme]STO27615.1 phage portal protein, PBSX family [Fusobacterium naviforme]
MAKRKSGMQVRIIKEQKQEQPVTKADTSTQVTTQDAFNAGDWITPPLDLRGLKRLVKNSTILPQCIRAYKNNICGFGIGVRYIDDVDETPEMAAEFKRAEEVIELLNIEQDTKEVFEDLIEARETYGIAYLEVIRNMADEVVQIEFIKETPSITKTKPLDPYVSSIYYHHGQQAERKKRYCKYRQEIGGQVVFFKEFGDPRIMDRRDGKYLTDGETLELEYQANEVMEFAIGTEPYGEIRWLGQMLGVDGSRKAEGLNNNYFENGRHTPLMIMIKGGTLSDESFEKLQQYMNDIKGEAGQHAFIVLETESTDGRVDFDATDKPEIEIKDLASILQKDELFQDYLDNNRRKVQSAFQLPDIYVGYTTDFNRATAQTAQEVTEEQVFQPERKSLAWAINNRLLNGYQFKYVECYFLEPDISNPDDLVKILTLANAAGGLTPNKAKQIVYEAFGEVSEDYEEEWGDIPLAFQKQQSGAGGGFDMGQMMLAMQQQITKAENANDDAVVAVMKEVKRLLEKRVFTNDPKRGIIKGDWNEDAHPRDDNGRFTSGGGGGAGSGSESGEQGSLGAAAPAVGNFGGADTATFTSACSEAKAEMAKIHPDAAWRVTDMSQADFEEEHPGSVCHVTAGGSTAAVTKDGDIVSVCKNPGDTIGGKELLRQAVEAGGTKLDSYEGNHGFYIKCGFEPVSWCKWDGQYAPDGWDSKRDKPEDIIFYKYTGGRSEYKTASAFKEAVQASADYGAAQQARDDNM